MVTVKIRKKEGKRRKEMNSDKGKERERRKEMNGENKYKRKGGEEKERDEC